MPEQVDLTAPIVRTQTTWKLAFLRLDLVNKLIEIGLIGTNQETLNVVYPTPAPLGSSQPTGAALLTALNTANLTSNSLVKRVFARLITDGHITGSVTGAPE